MSDGEFQRRTIRTWSGGLSLWEFAEPPDDSSPVLLVLLDSVGAPEQVGGLPALLAELCHVAIAELPLRGPDAPVRAYVPHLAAILDEAVHLAFRGRPVTLLAIGDAALVAVRATAPEIMRIVALDPPLRSEACRPLAPALRARVAGQDVAAGVREFIHDVYGIQAGRDDAERDHRPVFSRLQRPLDLIVGARAPDTAAADGDVASLVSVDDRAWLARQANVRVALAEKAGHDVVRAAGALLVSSVRKAVEWTMYARQPLATRAKGLALACPRDAGRLAYIGAEPEAFREAYLSVNPTAVVAVSEIEGACDVIALLDPDPDGVRFPDLLGQLAPEGALVALNPLGDAWRRIEARLATAGVALAPPDLSITPLGATLVRGMKGEAQAVTPVELVTYARPLMDIRTSLPAQGLRTSPGLAVHLSLPPLHSPPQRGEPSVVLLQRPSAWTPETWAQTVARAILARQVLVFEIDDHPELIRQFLWGRSAEPQEWEPLRMVHAIQTSTEPLRACFAAINPEVRISPNAVFDLAPFPTGERPPRVFYGGVTRGPFAVAVAAALGPVIEAFPATEFHVVGDRAVFEALPTSRKTFSDYLPYAAYLDAMAACSISLSPVEDRPLIETKSDAKYLDAARAGVLTIGSPVVYGGTIAPGRNGLLAAKVEDWPRMLALALADPDAQRRMARAAWEDVRDNRMFGRQVEANHAWYASLLARREALDQAVLERSPAVAAELAVWKALRKQR